MSYKLINGLICLNNCFSDVPCCFCASAHQNI